MPNEVKGTVAKLTTTVRWDKDEEKRVTLLRITVADITPEQLSQLLLFQSSPALNFSITTLQGVLEEARVAAAKYEAKSE